jgi:hypothetical protein
VTPTRAHERLDALGVLDDAHGAGTYGLTVAVPDAVDAVQRRWLNAIDAPLPDAYAEQLAAADRTLYVGRSGDVYARIMDEHGRGRTRSGAGARWGRGRCVDGRGIVLTAQERFSSSNTFNDGAYTYR